MDIPLKIMGLCSRSIFSTRLCQVLFDSFVEINKRLLPHSSLVFTGGVDHLLGGVYHGHQGVPKIVVLQGSIMIREAIDELQYVRVIPGNDLFTDDFQVPCLAEGCQLSISHRKLSIVLKLDTSQENLEGEKQMKRRKKKCPDQDFVCGIL